MRVTRRAFPGVLALVAALGACHARRPVEPDASPAAVVAHEGQLIEYLWPANDLARPPAVLEVEGALPGRARLHVHPLAFRERFGVHLTPMHAVPHTLRLLDAEGGVLRSWSLDVQPRPWVDLEPTPEERWLERYPEITADAHPRLMQALAGRVQDLRRLAGLWPWQPQDVSTVSSRLADHAARVGEMAANLVPPWAPAARPAAPDRGRFDELARGLADDTRALAEVAPGLGRSELTPRLDAIERDRCTTCHLGFRFPGMTRKDPARAPSGAYAVLPALVGEPAMVGDPLNGNRLFLRHCHACHGVDADRGPARKLLTTEPPDLRDPAFLHQRSDLDLVRTILGGGADRGLSAEMPPWGTTLSELEIWDLVGHLRATVPGPPANLAAYEEMPWGAAIPLPDDADVELARIVVWRARDRDGARRYVAVAPTRLRVVSDGEGREVELLPGPMRPEDGSDVALAREALRLARAADAVRPR